MSRKINIERKGIVLAALCALSPRGLRATDDWTKDGRPAVVAVNRCLGDAPETSRAEIDAVAPNLTESNFEEWKLATEEVAQKVANAAAESSGDSETPPPPPGKTSAKKAKVGAQHPHEKYECGCETKTRQETDGHCVACGKDAKGAKWKALGAVFAVVLGMLSLTEPAAAAGLLTGGSGIAIGFMPFGIRLMMPAGEGGDGGTGEGGDDAIDLSDDAMKITGFGEGIATVGDIKAKLAVPENYNPEKIAQALGEQTSEFGGSEDWNLLVAQAKAARMTQGQLDEFGVGFLKNLEKAGADAGAALLKAHEEAGITDHDAFANSINAAIPGGGKLTADMVKGMPTETLQTLKALSEQKALPAPGGGNNPPAGFDPAHSVEFGGKTYGLNPKDKDSIRAFASTIVTQKDMAGKEHQVKLIDASNRANEIWRRARTPGMA